MELKENTVMSMKELADWFGIKLDSLNSNKKKKFEELKNFCDFTIVNNRKIFIEEVFIPVYKKKASVARQIVEDKWENYWDDTGWDSCTRVGQELYKNEFVNLKNVDVKCATVINYTSRAKRENYGVAYVRSGKKGSCEVELCIKAENDVLVPLNDEQKKIKNNLWKKYFGNADDKMIVVQAMVNAGEIKKEDAWGVFEEWTGLDRNFMDFLKDLQAELGCKVIRGTYIPNLDEGAVDWSDKGGK